MTERQQQAGIAPNDFLASLADLDDCVRIKDRGVAKLRTVRQRMEKQGCDLAALDLALRLRKLGEDDAQVRLRNALRYCVWMDMPVGAQGALFSDDADRPSEKARQAFTAAQAYDEGYKAGVKGRDRHDSRFPAGTPMAAEHDRGWIAGQTELADMLGRDMPEDGAALKPEKKGAPPKKGTTRAVGKPRGRGAGRGRGRSGSSAAN